MQGITVVVISFLSLWSSMEDSKDLNRFSFYLKRIFENVIVVTFLIYRGLRWF